MANEADFLCEERTAEERDMEEMGWRGFTVRERSMKRSLIRRRF